MSKPTVAQMIQDVLNANGNVLFTDSCVEIGYEAIDEDPMVSWGTFALYSDYGGPFSALASLHAQMLANRQEAHEIWMEVLEDEAKA